jgi:hypothetical protein
MQSKTHFELLGIAITISGLLFDGCSREALVEASTNSSRGIGDRALNTGFEQEYE